MKTVPLSIIQFAIDRYEYPERVKLYGKEKLQIYYSEKGNFALTTCCVLDLNYTYIFDSNGRIINHGIGWPSGWTLAGTLNQYKKIYKDQLLEPEPNRATTLSTGT